MQDYKRDTWKNTDVVFLAPAYLPDPPTHTHHCPGSSPPSFFPQKQLLSATGMPSHSFRQLSLTTSPFTCQDVPFNRALQVHVGRVFFSISTRSAHKWFKNKTGRVLCTSLYQRPFYRFYTKIFLLRSLFIIVLTNVNYKRYQWGKKVPYTHSPAIPF